MDTPIVHISPPSTPLASSLSLLRRLDDDIIGDEQIAGIRRRYESGGEESANYEWDDYHVTYSYAFLPSYQTHSQFHSIVLLFLQPFNQERGGFFSFSTRLTPPPLPSPSLYLSPRKPSILSLSLFRSLLSLYPHAPLIFLIFLSFLFDFCRQSDSFRAKFSRKLPIPRHFNLFSIHFAHLFSLSLRRKMRIGFRKN